MGSKATKPVFIQDDEDCIFLDTQKDSDGDDLDMYICDTKYLIADKSIIVRYGNEGSHYTSYPIKVLEELRTMVLNDGKDVEIFQYFFNAIELAKNRDLL